MTQNFMYFLMVVSGVVVLQSCDNESNDGGNVGSNSDSDTDSDTDADNDVDSSCAEGLECVDLSGEGDYSCMDPYGIWYIPEDATDCYSSEDCDVSSGYDCWTVSSDNPTGLQGQVFVCLKSCKPTDPGDDTDDSSGEVDCANENTDSCGYLICQNQSTIDDLIDTCDFDDDIELKEYCNDSIACFEDYHNCLLNACPPGTTTENADSDLLSTCTTDLSSCVSALSV